MSAKPAAAPPKIVKLPRMLKSDVRPMERCCGHHLLAHDTLGCLIHGCACRNRAPRAVEQRVPGRGSDQAAPLATIVSILERKTPRPL